MARSTAEPQPNETAMGASTVLPGVPLPAWTLPAEVLPEPQDEPAAAVAEEEHAESALEAALLVAAMAAPSAQDAVPDAPAASAPSVPSAPPAPSVPAAPEPSPFAAPPAVDDAVQIAPPQTRSLPVPEAPTAPTVAPTVSSTPAPPTSAPAPAGPASEGVVTIGGAAPSSAPTTPPWDGPAPEAPFAPHDTLPQIPAPAGQDWDAAAAALTASAAVTAAAVAAPGDDDVVPHHHTRDTADAPAEPARRRFGLRRKAKTVDEPVSEPGADASDLEPTEVPGAPVALAASAVAAGPMPSPTDARVDLPAPTNAAVDLPAPSDAALDLPAPADQPGPAAAPLDLPAPADAVVDLPAPGDAPADLPSPMTAAPGDAAPVDLPAPAGAPVAAVAAPELAASVGAEPVSDDLAAAELDDEPRSRRPLVLLAAVGGAAVVAAVAAFVWPGLLVSHDDAIAPTPASAMPTASAPVAPVTLQTPDKAATYTKIAGAPATALAQAASGTTLDGFTAPVTAVYGEAGVPRATVIAWAATSPTSPASITAAFAGFVNASGVAVTSIQPVATGTLGGSMRCGITTVSGKPATACFWADDASFGAVTVLEPATPADGATTATAIRLTVETRG